MLSRIGLNILVCIGILFLPWWITIIFFAGLSLTFRAPEIIIWGLVMDMLYGAPHASVVGIPLLFTFFAIILFFTAEFLKRRLALYN